MLSSPDVKFRKHRRGAVAVLAVLLVMPAVGRAQGDAGGGGGPVISFAGLSQMLASQDHTVVQLRRFFSPSGVTAVREEARVQANGTAEPDYELEFLGVEGEPNGSPLWQYWDQTYRDHGKLFFEHGLFRVRDLSKVHHNYVLHDFGTTLRIGRAVQRVVVFPNELDKSIWLLEVDIATNVPLYTAEYDAQMRLLSEVEAVSFLPGSHLGPPSGSATTVTVLPTFDAAQTFMGAPAGLVEPLEATAEYELHKVEVRTDPLNNRQTLVLAFTDGVDEFFVIQGPGVPDSFAGLPVRQKTEPSHTIARYRDPAMSVLLFWENGVSFQVAGRGSLLRLDEFAQAIYIQALLDN